MGKTKGHRLPAALAGRRALAGEEGSWRDHLTSPSVLRELLRSRGVAPRHQLGQHFLTDGNILRKFLAACQLSSADAVVEVGAGVGTLTRPLGRLAGWVLALELDEALGRIAREAVEDLESVALSRADALRVDWSEVLAEARRQVGAGGAVKVVGNLPYYLTSPLLYQWLEQPLPWDLLVLTLQKEAADRLVASPGSKAYGALSVWAALRGEARAVARVAPSCFYPRPEVWSEIVTLQKRVQELPPALSFVLRAAFGQRRKTLLNALAGSPLAADKAEAAALLREAGIDPGRRAETLPPGEFLALAVTWARLTSSGGEK